MKKIFILFMNALIVLVPLSGAGYITNTSTKIINHLVGNALSYNLNGGVFYNITVQDARELLSCTCNGIQIPIDVRTDNEWIAKHIDTHSPENPQHWPNLQNGENLDKFWLKYEGTEIILYCQTGNRSIAAAKLLAEHNFTGIIYNMLGGINAWIAAGYPTIGNGYINITVEQTYNLLINTSNGIQIPIDVRTPSEWATEHIDTPSPENPNHWPNLQNGENLTKFMDLYRGKVIILYCLAGSRSTAAANLLVANNFTGVIYNILGGMNAWIAAGYPTKANSIPSMSIITGENDGKIGQEYPYTFTATDIDQDDVYYYVNWSDNTTNQLIGPYHSGKEVTISHVWSEKGTYMLKVKARDVYEAESGYVTLEIKMPYSYKPISPFLELLFQRFPNAFPILRQLVG